jgi:hypothetical protein
VAAHYVTRNRWGAVHKRHSPDNQKQSWQAVISADHDVYTLRFCYPSVHPMPNAGSSRYRPRSSRLRWCAFEVCPRTKRLQYSSTRPLFKSAIKRQICKPCETERRLRGISKIVRSLGGTSKEKRSQTGGKSHYRTSVIYLLYLCFAGWNCGTRHVEVNRSVTLRNPIRIIRIGISEGS